jgi:hypothetical protein
MSGLITWEQPEFVTRPGRRRPAFAEDAGFTARWWGHNADFTPPDYIGPTPHSKLFWDRFAWPMCDCEDCDSRDLIVRRPA